MARRLYRSSFLLVALGRLALSQVTGGTISGVVTDPSGRPVPGVSIAVTRVATRELRTLSTDTAGFYVAPNLPPADYEITASRTQFASRTTHVTLAVSVELELNFALQLGTVNQSIDAEEPNGVDHVSATLGEVVNQRAVQELPLNGRSWTDLAELNPGVAPVEAIVSYTTGPNRANRGYGAQIAVSGGRPQQNNYLLDGISINDYSNGGPGSVLGGNLGVDAIQEFSILSGNYPAMYGKASGGVISGITRSGTNEFHGAAYEFIRNSALDARNFFDGHSPPAFRRNQFGADAGGPIRRERTFFFGNYEGIRQSTGVTDVVTVPSAAARAGDLSTGKVTVSPAVQPYFAFYPLPNAGLLGAGDTGVFKFTAQQPTNEDFANARVDHRLSKHDDLFGSYRIDNAEFSTPDTLATQLLDSNTRAQTASITESHVFGPAALNSLRFGISRDVAIANLSANALIPAAADTSLGVLPGQYAPGITVPGLTAFSGGLGGAGTYFFHYTSLQLYDDFFFTAGRHSIKFGGALERMRNNILARSEPDGQFTFNSLAGFLTDSPATFNIGLASSLTPRGLRQTLAAGYVQDDWRVASRLSVNLGLRYEMVTVPTEVQGKLSVLRAITDAQPHLGNPYFANPTLRNFEPRVGLAWDPFGTGKTSVRAGFGIYDELPLTYQFELLSTLVAPFYINRTVSSLPPGSFPSGAVSLLKPASLAQAYIEPNPHRNYVLQWNVSVERALSRDTTAAITYVGNHGVHDPFRTDDVNLVLPTQTAQGFEWPTPIGSGTVLNPNAGQIRALFWEGSSIYHALQLQLRRRMSHGLQLEGAFTWSKSIDDGSSTLVGNAFSNSYNGPPFFDLKLDRGVSDFNIPRLAVISGIWEIPAGNVSAGLAGAFLRGWQLGGILRASDGIPFTPLIAGDALGEKSAATEDFPNRVVAPGCGAAVNAGNPNHYINTSCFTFPTPANLLGDSGRNILEGPGLVNLDISAAKAIYFPGLPETLHAQFRAEFFNALNRANFLPPLDNLKLFDATGHPVAGAGLIDATATTSRQIQFALKLVW